ncbi:MAG TPA: hypothetical protein VGM08_02895 [Candidatus Saccharimonadales bacterium]
MISLFDSINPIEFLKAVYAIDGIAGVRIADKWLRDKSNPDLATIGRQFCITQTTIKYCPYCNWPLFGEQGDYEHSLCEQAISYTIDDILADFCDHPGCWQLHISSYYDFCERHEPKCKCGQFDTDCRGNCYEETDEERTSTGTVYTRALTAFHGDHDRAREASELYPGDFT